MENNLPQANLRLIKTARTEAAINEAVLNGFKVIVKPVVSSPEIKSKFAIIRNKATGLITVINDYRAKGYSILPNEHSETETLINFTYYYPHHFESPFAAYLIPPDIEVGETVCIEDLIEDIVGGSWNQGDSFRLNSSKAVWDGECVVIVHNTTDQFRAIG